MPAGLLGAPHLEREVPLVEVREILLRRGTDFGTRNVVLAELVRRARDSDPWTTGLAGVLLPGLRAILGRLVRAHPRHRADLEAEALLALVEAVREIDVERGRIAARLIWAARRGADRALDRELREERADEPLEIRARRETIKHRSAEAGEVIELDPVGHPDARPLTAGVPGHPEQILIDAWRAGVLSPLEVDVIGATRVARVPARAYAEERGVGLGSIRLKRYRAEQRLVAWLATR